nr:hypothetical protein [Streptomyces sp. SID7909]
MLVAIACSLVTAACAGHGGTDGSAEVNMNMQEAAERADGLLDEVFDGIHPAVQWTHGPTTTGSCDVTRRRVVMTVVSEDRRGSFLGLVDRFWRSRYSIKAVNKDPDVPAIFAQTGDGFGVSLMIGGQGQAFFEVDSPCVRKSKVAAPVSKPNGPDYAGAEVIPRPNVRDGFWSVGAP